jgi:hypothetical protein
MWSIKASSGSSTSVTSNQTTTAEIASIDLSGNPVFSVATDYGTCASCTMNLGTFTVQVR